MGKNIDNIINKRYGKLLVINDSGKRYNGGIIWTCRCDCGETKDIRGQSLKSGNSNSCGKCSENVFYKHADGYMIGKCSNGEEFIFDNEDFDLIKNFTWTSCKESVSYSIFSYINGKNTKIHRLIMNVPEDLMVDHINHNTSDNRKLNLRIVTNQQNTMNKRKYKGTSKYKGVSWNKNTGKWLAKIGFNLKSIYIGSFILEDDAAEAYNEYAKKYFGEYAVLNNIENGDVKTC